MSRKQSRFYTDEEWRRERAAIKATRILAWMGLSFLAALFLMPGGALFTMCLHWGWELGFWAGAVLSCFIGYLLQLTCCE